MILETLSKIIHPAADKDIVSLGLVEDIKLFDGNGAAVEPTDPQAGRRTYGSAGRREGRAGPFQAGRAFS